MTDKSYDHDNIFAKILRDELPAHKVYEDEYTIAIMDIMPRGDGHVLVIPKVPSRNLLDMTDADLAHTMRSVQIVGKAVIDAFGADGLTIQQFNEPAGGQVVFHTHFHVIPRFDSVGLRPHTGDMADPDVLAVHAETIRQSLA